MFNGFRYEKNILCIEQVSIDHVATEVGTPFYIYGCSSIESAYRSFDTTLEPLQHLICFAVKSNNNIAILSLFSKMGAGADVVSGGELYKALKAGIPPQKIVFSGVGKSREEIEYGLDKEILMFNIESEHELLAIDTLARTMNKHPQISIRVNPDIDAETHPYIATGIKINKFGIPIRRAISLVKVASNLKHVRCVGISCHIGSQLTSYRPFRDCFQQLVSFYDRLVRNRFPIQYINVGGGLGIRYNQEEPPSIPNYTKLIADCIGSRPVTVICEPGRRLVGPAGALITRVIRVKRGEMRNFIVVDAAMNDLIRPALYNAHHRIVPVHRKKYRTLRADVVGPICESSDFFALRRNVPNFQPGDLVAVLSAGAYGMSMSSNYNARPRVAEVLAHDKKAELIRERETFKDLIARERVPQFITERPINAL